ncbi:MAG: hypothetical protein HQL58_02210 [Magnetococcales bacterium]|nr:hypothetical protein [Magnetococcales bacterium]
MDQQVICTEIGQLAALVRDGQVGEAEKRLVALTNQAPESVAQWIIVNRLLTVADADHEQSVEMRLREYGAAPARSYRNTLKLLDHLAVVRAEERVTRRRLQHWLTDLQQTCSDTGPTQVPVAPRMIPAATVDHAAFWPLRRRMQWLQRSLAVWSS